MPVQAAPPFTPPALLPASAQPGGAGARLATFGLGVLGSLLLQLVCFSGCQNQEEEKARAVQRIYIEDASKDQSEGRYTHEFTLVNGNNLPVTSVTIRFHYADRDGKVLGSFDARFNQYLEAHDAVRKINVDGGPLIIRGDKVRYEVTNARTTLVRRKQN